MHLRVPPGGDARRPGDDRHSGARSIRDALRCSRMSMVSARCSSTSSPCRLPMRRPWSPRCPACGVPGSDRHADVRAMAAALGERYPGDAGVVTALLLNLVHLKPGEALFLGAGSPRLSGRYGRRNHGELDNGSVAGSRRSTSTSRHCSSSTPDRSNRSCSARLSGDCSYDTRFPSSCSTSSISTVRRPSEPGDLCAPTVRSMPVCSRSSAVQRHGSPLVTGSSNCEDAEPHRAGVNL